MKYRVVTTFAENDPLAEQFLESYTKHWNTEIYVYYEGKKPEFKHRLVKYYSLDADKDRKAFIKRNENRDVPQADPGNAYRWDWKRFCHKVFALTNPRNTKNTDWLIWLDADVITLDTVDDAFLEQVCKGDVSYVGRDEFTHPDCAFVAYNVTKARKHPKGMSRGGARIIDLLRDKYKSGLLFDYDEWHDSHVFHKLITNTSASYPVVGVNLSPGIPGMQVFDDCILGTKMKHLKGPLRKKGLPVPQGGYASQQELTTHTGQQIPVSGMRPIQIKTKNCVPHANIQANIHYNVTLVSNWIMPCRMNMRAVTFCSGGPSLEKFFDDIKKNQEAGHMIVCVKHAHDRMIEAGIIPDMCILLDPRGHVQDFIENPHPDVIYMISSMVHPSTTDRLLEKNARILGYHAHVGAEEDKVLMGRQLAGVLIGGGCSAAMRGISVLNAVGFQRFQLYGYDLCFYEKPFEGDTAPTKPDGTPEYLEVQVHGRKFWTDPEKVAQAQDFENILKENKLEIEAHGPGMIPHMWAATHQPKQSFEDLIAATRRLAPGEPEPGPGAGDG